jgi:pimeloyl-ACP methyl ester carboxylesterase
MLMLHGILGSGANWRGFARRLAAACPAWGFVLVDLRMHGQSQGAVPPHTIEAAADDLARLGVSLQLPLAGVLGHSFGGKVAVAFVQRRELEQAWVLDASPGASPGRRSMADAVIRALRGLPASFGSREDFLERIVAEGYARSLAEWLAMNLRRTGDQLRFGLDLDAMAALLESYRRADLWPVLERGDGARRFHVVVAGRSDAFDANDRARLAEVAARQPRVRAHRIEGAGHWVHVDAPDALFELVRAELE